MASIVAGNTRIFGKDVHGDREARATPGAPDVHPKKMPIPPLNEAAIATFSRLNL